MELYCASLSISGNDTYPTAKIHALMARKKNNRKTISLDLPNNITLPHSISNTATPLLLHHHTPTLTPPHPYSRTTLLKIEVIFQSFSGQLGCSRSNRVGRSSLLLATLTLNAYSASIIIDSQIGGNENEHGHGRYW